MTEPQQRNPYVIALLVTGGLMVVVGVVWALVAMVSRPVDVGRVDVPYMIWFADSMDRANWGMSFGSGFAIAGAVLAVIGIVIGAIRHKSS